MATVKEGNVSANSIQGGALPRAVYLGAVQYESGPTVPLEAEISDKEICTKLRAPNHGADRIPRWSRNIVELAEVAAQKSIASSGWASSAIEAVFLVSNGLDAQNNLDAAWLGMLSNRLGLRQATHYQVGMAGCAGFHWAAKLAAALIGSGQCERILIISFDKGEGPLQRLYGEGTDFPYLTGDAAAACVLSSTNDAMQYKLLGKVINIWDGEQALRVSLDEEARCIGQLFQEVLASASLAAEDIDLLITNNYSFDVSRLYGLLANVSYAKIFTDTIPTHAHCFASDNIINLYRTQGKVSVVVGQRLMLFSAGPFQWGACLLEKLKNTHDIHYHSIQ